MRNKAHAADRESLKAGRTYYTYQLLSPEAHQLTVYYKHKVSGGIWTDSKDLFIPEGHDLNELTSENLLPTFGFTAGGIESPQKLHSLPPSWKGQQGACCKLFDSL